MKALKKLRIRSSGLIITLILFITFGLSAQSTIGIKLPAYKSQQPAPSFSEKSAFSFVKKPFELDEFFFLSTYETNAFNSPLVDDVLTAFAVIHQFNHSNMPFFCKIEYQMEQTSGFPVKFRLGDVQYVDLLEGKRDYVVPVW